MPEALAGVHVGQVLSREIEFSLQAPRSFLEPKATPDALPQGEVRRGLARSETLSMRGSTLRENRETLQLPTADGAVGRDGKSEDPSHRCTEQGV